MNLKQPAIGVVSTLLVSALSLVFISLFDFPPNEEVHRGCEGGENA
jgi:hypothetical protein